MASSYPMKKNTSVKIVFPILDADGDLVISAAALDSEYSLDGGAFSDCTNEATEIGSTGIYHLTLTAGETNGDVVCIQVKTTTSGAKTTVLVFYTSAQTLDEVDTVVDAIKAVTDNLPDSGALTTIQADLDNPTQYKADVSALALEATLTAIKGTGFDTTTDSLVKIHDDHVTHLSAAPSTHAAADVWTVGTRALTDKAGFSLSAAGIDAIIDDVIEGSLTLRQAIRIYLAALAGKSTGGGTSTLTFRDNADSKARITATVDADGNRTAITLDGT